MRDRQLDRLFERYRSEGDVVALEQVFDATAAELLALGMHFVRDPGEAEDLLQATFLTAIERADRYDARRRLVPWLVGILVRHAHRLRRNQRRPLDGARLTAIPPTDPVERAERSELADSIERALSTLPKKYREVLEPYLLREERAAEIALSSGRSPGTVRVQIHRGLDLLRRALPAGLALGGSALVGGRGLAAVRAEVVRCGATTATKAGATSAISVTSLSLLGGMIMSQKLVYAAIAAALLATTGLFVALDHLDPTDPTPDPPATPDEALAGGGSRPAPLADGEGFATEEVTQRVELAVAPPAATKTPLAGQEESLAEVRGRLLLPGGAPAIDAKVQMRGSEANRDRTGEFGLPTGYEDPLVEVDREGRFAICFDPPQAYQFRLDATIESCPGEGWHWGRIEPGAVIDIGTVTFKSPGTIIGTFLDREGEPLGGEWRVHARIAAEAPTGGRTSTPGYSMVDPSTGCFRIEGAPPGPVQLQVSSPVTKWRTDGPLVLVVAGEEVSAEIVYDGLDPRRIFVKVSTRPFDQLSVEEGNIHLSAPGLQAREARRLEDYLPTFAIDGLDPGAYTLEIDDPRFQPWIRRDVHPGTQVDAELSGNAAIRLEVVDGETGEPVEEYQLDVRLDGTRARPRLVRFLEAGRRPPGGGLFDGLIPSSQTLFIQVEGYATCELSVPDLQPFESRPVRAELFQSARLSGIVYQADRRTSAPRARVSLVPVGEMPSLGRVFAGVDRPLERVAWCDDAGRFELTDVPAGLFTLFADSEAILIGRIEELEVRSGESLSDLVLVLPGAASLQGRLIAPAGADFTDFRLVARPVEEPSPGSDITSRFPPLSLDLESTGEFTGGPFPSGEFALSLRHPSPSLPLSFGRMFTLGTALECARFELTAGEVTELECDLRDSWQGAIRVEVRVGGQPAVGWVIEVSEPGVSSVTLTGGITGADGFATVESLFPGEYEVIARSVEGAWRVPASGPVRVVPGGVADCAIEILLAAGVLLVLDEESGAPLANQELEVQGNGYVCLHETTDAKGRLELELPAGSYRIRRPGSGDKPGQGDVLMQWTERGPQAAELRLPAKSN